MKLPLLRRGSYASVASTVALVLAVSGTSAYAATVITTKQIKNGTIRPADLHGSAVTNAKIAPNAVTGAKIYERSITKADLAPGTVPGVRACTRADTNNVELSGPVIGVSVPSGTYLVSAVTQVTNTDGLNEATVSCALTGQGAQDYKTLHVERSAANSPNRAILSLQLTNTLTTSGQFLLTCSKTDANSVLAAHSRITAVRVDQLQVQD